MNAITFLFGTIVMMAVIIPFTMLSVRWAWKRGWNIRKIFLIVCPAGAFFGSLAGAAAEKLVYWIMGA